MDPFIYVYEDNELPSHSTGLRDVYDSYFTRKYQTPYPHSFILFIFVWSNHHISESDFMGKKMISRRSNTFTKISLESFSNLNKSFITIRTG